MITLDKLRIYKKYRGDGDNFVRIGHENEKTKFNRNDWLLLDDLFQNKELIIKRLTTDDFRNNFIQYMKINCDLEAFNELTKDLNQILIEMKEHYFSNFIEALIRSTSEIEDKYFRLPVTYRDYIYRERAYCYELYHQLRQFLPNEFPYTLSGEINKAGHPLIAPYCGQIIPDFLIHNPGHMGPDDNLVIVEVKTIQGADYNVEGEGLLKDLDTIRCMTTLENGYFRGIILVFGSGHDDRKSEITRIFNEKNNTGKLLLLFHDNPLTEARVVDSNNNTNT